MTAILSAFTGAATQIVFPSGDVTGVTDAARLAAAISTAGAPPWTLRMSELKGPWYINGGQVAVTSGTGKLIDATNCLIFGTGSGSIFDFSDATTYNPRTLTGGGIIGYPTIDGTNMTGAGQPFHAGDIQNMQMLVRTRLFTIAGSKGGWFDNRFALTEGAQVDVFSQSNAGGVVFDNSVGASGQINGSFDRITGKIRFVTNGVGDGVVVQNGAFLAGHQFNINGNMNTNAGTTYAALRLTGSNSGGFSGIGFDGQLLMDVELDDAVNTKPQTIVFGAANNYLRGTGVINFSQATAFAASNNTGQFQFYGDVRGDSSLFSLQTGLTAIFSQAITGNGQTIATLYLGISKVTGTGGFTGLILAAGTYVGQQVVVENASGGALTFAAAATSNVADGATTAIAANTSRTFVWDPALGVSGQWTRTSG